jgi:cation:H+ antiporter
VKRITKDKRSFVSEFAFYILLSLAGFVFLAGGAELLVRGASRLAATFNVPSVVIGLTVVAFGTSLPELLVSVIANIQGDGGSEIAIGNIVGSNIGNLGMILGVAGLMAVLPVERHLLRNEYPILAVVSAIFVVMSWNGSIDRVEGVILMIGLLGFTYYSYSAQRGTPEEMEHYVDVASAVDHGVGKPSRRPLVDAGLILLGLIGLVLGARWLIDGAEFIARSFGISELVIGLTLVAAGTSLPELATTVIAVMRKEGDIAVGNVVGSNLFNMLFIGGLSAVIRPLPVPLHMRWFDFPTMIGLTILVYIFAATNGRRMLRWQGGILLAIYLSYTIFLFVANGA